MFEINMYEQEYKLPPVIGLVGAAKHGKTTAAHVLAEIGYVRLPLAQPIKNMLKAGFMLTEAELNGVGKEKNVYKLSGKSPRVAMQTLGTEWGRNLIGPNVWLNAWVQTRDAMGARYVVIDDIRFQNEMELVHNLGGVLFEIVRPDQGYIKSNEHPSEVEWARNRDMIDWTVMNDDGVGTLQARLEKALYGVSEKVVTEKAS